MPRKLHLVDTGHHALEGSGAPTAGNPADSLVTRYLPLARGLARQYSGRGEPLDDLIQVASLGLVKAARRYDERRGGFATYATQVVNGELRRHFRDHTWSVHVPRGQKDRAVRVATAIRRERERTGIDPTPSELARQLGLTDGELVDAKEAWHAFRPESLDAPASGVDRSDAPSLSDRLGDLDDEYERVNARVTRLVAMRRISLRDRRILYLRYVEHRSQRDIADRVGISPMSVSRALGRILKELDLAAA